MEGVGGVAAVGAKLKQGPKKDPWAVPTGDPYKAPTTGRDSSVAGGLPATGVAPAAEAAEATPATTPEADPTVPSPSATDSGEGTDAWSSAQDWADNSAVPSTTATANRVPAPVVPRTPPSWSLNCRAAALTPRSASVE